MTNNDEGGEKRSLEAGRLRAYPSKCGGEVVRNGLKSATEILHGAGESSNIKYELWHVFCVSDMLRWDTIVGLIMNKRHLLTTIACIGSLFVMNVFCAPIGIGSKDMNMVTNRDGHVFADFVTTDESKLATTTPFSPLTCALVVAKHDGKTLLVFDTWKQHWELPGGGIKKGETARECAVREFKEETGASVDNLAFMGVAKFILSPDSRIEFGAIYSGTIDELPTFNPNNEISKIRFWDNKDDIESFDEIDRALIDMK